MSNVSSNHSFVCSRAGHNEMYSSGHKDLDNLSEERNSSASSLSSRDEGLETEWPEDEFIQNLEDTKPPI